MKIPKKINDIIRKKIEYIETASTKLEMSIVKAQEKLLNDVISEIVPQLDVDAKGNIKNNIHNYKLISKLDKVYTDFDKVIANMWLKAMNETGSKIHNLTYDYLELVLAGNLPMRFSEVLENTKALTDLRFGLKEGKFVRGGFLLDNIFMYGQEEFKRELSKAISSQMNMKDFIRLIKLTIQGDEKKLGSIEKKYRAFAYDVYQQWDRTYQNNIIQEFKMDYFIYTGGLIKESRDFCVAHNDKVWSVEEAQTWKDWTPKIGIKNNEFPEGYKIQQKDLNAHPGYMDYEGYDPIIDLGGYNCRHYVSPISNELALKLRPKIKGKKLQA